MKAHTSYLIFPILFFSLVSYFMQTNIYFSGDVCYLMHVTHQLLAGGMYGKDFFETNPPMILYLYTPVCVLAKLFSMNEIELMRCYIFLLALSSIAACYILINKIVEEKDKVIVYTFMLALSFVLLILPGKEFGQREHLLIILIFPYLLSIILTLKNHSLHFFQAFPIGVLAGLAFALKPFYLATFILVELYVMARKRCIWASLRIESITIATILFAYLVSIFVYQPEYVKIMLPLLNHFYFFGMRETWVSLVYRVNVIYSFAILICAIFYIKNCRYQDLMGVIILVLAGLILAFIIPMTPWNLHVLPALGVACILSASCFGELLLIFKKNKLSVLKDSAFIVLFAAVLFYVPLLFTYKTWNYAVQDKKNGPLNQLVSYIEKLPGEHSVSCFSIGTTEDCFPLVYTTHSDYGTRFPFFWWIRGVLKREKSLDKQELSDEVQNAKTFLFEKVIEDFNQLQPRFVIINTEDPKLIISEQFSFLGFFFQNKKFRDVWKHYRYLTSVSYYQIYQRVA